MGFIIGLSAAFLSTVCLLGCEKSQQTRYQQNCSRDVAYIETAYTETEHVFSTGDIITQGFHVGTLTHAKAILLRGHSFNAKVTLKLYLVGQYTDYVPSSVELVSVTKTLPSGTTVFTDDYWFDLPTPFDLDPSVRYSMSVTVDSGMFGVMEGPLTLEPRIASGYYSYIIGGVRTFPFTNMAFTFGAKFITECATTY